MKLFTIILMLLSLIFVSCADNGSKKKNNQLNKNSLENQYVNFADINFEACVKSAKVWTQDEYGDWKSTPVDQNGDKKISLAEASEITSLNCSTMRTIKSLDGIQSFVNLEKFNCSGNQIESMPDFSSLKKLEKLRCVNNYFSDADCANLDKLKQIGLDTLEIEKQKDGRLLTCDQIGLVGRIKTQAPKNNLNDVWGFTHNEEEYAVYGDVSHVHIVKIRSVEPYYEKVASIDRGMKFLAWDLEQRKKKEEQEKEQGDEDSEDEEAEEEEKPEPPKVDLWKDVNHSIWGEFRYFRQTNADGSKGKAYIYASGEGNWKLFDNEKEIFPNLVIIDVTDITKPVRVDTSGIDQGLRSIHNITIDYERGLLIAFGGTDHEGEETENGWRPAWRGARIYDLNETPESPKYLTTIGELYVHDGQIKNHVNEQGELISSKLFLAMGTTAIHWDANKHHNKENCVMVYDLLNLKLEYTDPVEIETSRRRDKENYISCSDRTGQVETINNTTKLMGLHYENGYAHNVWVNEYDVNDQSEMYIIITGETSVDDQLSFWNLSLQADGTYVPTFRNGLNLQGGALAHNAFIRGNHIYASHYSKGVQVAEMYTANDGKKNMRLVWGYDTYPQNNIGRTEGCWGVYPFSEVEDLFFATDSYNGFFIFKKSEGFLNSENESR